MENKNNIDAIIYTKPKVKRLRPPKVVHMVRRVTMDEIRRPAPPPSLKPLVKKLLPRLAVVKTKLRVVPQPFYSKVFYNQFFVPITVFVACIAFAGGMSVALQTPKSAADTNTAVAEISVVDTTEPPPSTQPSVSNDAIFNTPLDLLKQYFQSSSEEKVLALRKQNLKTFLQQHNSPLIDDSDLIAQQPHWKLILAISFAESTLGKNCYDFNCSGIGGSQIRSYKSFGNWILDFNRLLEKRYDNWTLEQMCGVYVKPCTTSWLNATKQILDELDGSGIG